MLEENKRKRKPENDTENTPENKLKKTINTLISIIKPMKQDAEIYKHYIKNNKKFFIWIISYIFLLWLRNGFREYALVAIIIMYYISIKIALSEIGEKTLRALQDCRPLLMNKEKNKLTPIFQEVYNKALEKSPYLEKDIKLYIIDTIIPNAIAIGRKTIIITKGASDMMTDEEIKGILAHELGHIANGDTIIGLIFTIGNIIFLFPVLLIQYLLTKIEQVVDGLGLIFGLAKTASTLIITAFNIIGILLLTTSSRNQEYKADQYAHEIGYGNSLISALYKMYEYTISNPKKIFQQIQESHPRIAYRIGELENM